MLGVFIRGTRDSFPPARIASILALAATQQYFLLQEVANRILPALCPLTTDVDKGVRDNAFRTIRGFLSKLETVSEDPGLRESMGKHTFVFLIFKHIDVCFHKIIYKYRLKKFLISCENFYIIIYTFYESFTYSKSCRSEIDF